MDIGLKIVNIVVVLLIGINLWARFSLDGRMRRLMVRMSLLGVIVCIVITAALAFLLPEPTYDTPEEAFLENQDETGEIWYTIQGEELAVLVVGHDDVTMPYVSVKKDGKWCDISEHEGFGTDILHNIWLTVAFSNQCDEAVAYVYSSDGKKRIKTLSDSCHSEFQKKRMKRSDGTWYYLYYTILPKLDEDYSVQVNGWKLKPDYLFGSAPDAAS